MKTADMCLCTTVEHNTALEHFCRT